LNISNAISNCGRSIEPFFFGTHPHLVERIESYQESIEEHYKSKSGDLGVDRYCKIMMPLFIENATADLAIGRFEVAEESLNRVIREKPEHGRALYLLGEVVRQRNGEGDLQRTEDRYRQAIAADTKFPDPYGALGKLLLRRGDKQGAKALLQQYLDLAPQAPDRAYVVQELKNFDVPR
jgi:beta-barrel assembly-enhancing protease